jgi:hypothetical protein
MPTVCAVATKAKAVTAAAAGPRSVRNNNRCGYNHRISSSHAQRVAAATMTMMTPVTTTTTKTCTIRLGRSMTSFLFAYVILICYLDFRVICIRATTGSRLAPIFLFALVPPI